MLFCKKCKTVVNELVTQEPYYENDELDKLIDISRYVSGYFCPACKTEYTKEGQEAGK